MASDKISKIFRDELPKDLNKLESAIDKQDCQLMFEFAHKYKLRLFYLNYETCVILCHKVVDTYKNQQFNQQLEAAKELLALLESIHDKIKL